MNATETLWNVTVLVAGESAERHFEVLSHDPDTAFNQATSLLMADWSLDDRMNTDVELVGIRPVA